MREKKWKLAVLIFALVYIFYFYPVQRYLAKKTFSEYIQIQGSSEDNIKSKRIFKDYKQNGYIIKVVYKDDPDFVYDYKYSIDDIKNITNYKSIRCVVYTQDNESVELTGDNNRIKYPPIE